VRSKGPGLDDVEMEAFLTFLLGFARTCAFAEAEVWAAVRESQMSDVQWWKADAPLPSRVTDEPAYLEAPLLTTTP
jgi:hypothetical protein